MDKILERVFVWCCGVLAGLVLAMLLFGPRQAPLPPLPAEPEIIWEATEIKLAKPKCECKECKCCPACPGKE